MTKKIVFCFIICHLLLYTCNNPKQKKQTEKYISNSLYIEQGRDLAFKTKAILGKNLIGALSTNGTEYALDFCSTKAIHLTDSMSNALNSKIKRVSDKNRNPNNAANKRELVYINKTKAAISKGENPTPELNEINDKLLGYYPIISNEMCLQCHGQKNVDILPKTITKIDSLYPNDKAFGYKTNELRGIWVVEIEK